MKHNLMRNKTFKINLKATNSRVDLINFQKLQQTDCNYLKQLG